MQEDKRNSWFRAGFQVLLLLLLCLMPSRQARAAFESGSTCGDVFHNSTSCRGAFNPSVNTTVQLPPSGILDYTTFFVPQGVTVSFARNQANTPVIIRCSGNVNIEGVINVSGGGAYNTGTSGDGVLGDDGQPGVGGPGGYDGGSGGRSSLFGGTFGQAGGPGKGPGGGQSITCTYYGYGCAGGGGSYATADANNGSYFGANGATYGQATLLPLVGGSGGAGGSSGGTFNGAGGGGGGGAILIASSATITVGKNGVYGTARIYANGGPGGSASGDGGGGSGGGGSGGAIRLVADTITRYADAYLYAQRGTAGSGYVGGATGGYGRIRLEANSTNWSSYTDPGYSFGTPGKILVPNNPTLAITSVGGQAVPANPTGMGDVTMPQGTTSATVTVAATGIPRGTTVTVYVVPALGATRTSVLSTALDGASDDATTATAQVTLNNGNNVLLASATYTVTELLAMSLPKFNGEYVAKIRVESEMGGKSRIVYITASGKEYRLEDAAKS
ncbi:MAG TPA: hypothetical protein VI298_02230 [Geobacteraceae bacterium]